MIGAKAEFDESARVRHGFVLPAVIGLKAPQRVFGRGIPLPGRRARHVVLANQSFLDLMGTLGINLLLPADFLRVLSLARGSARRTTSRVGGF